MLRFGRRHERHAQTRAHQADAVDPRPDFLGDARDHADLREGREDAIVETGIVRPGEKDERGRGEIAEAQLFSGRQRMGCGEEDAVAFLQQQPGAQAGSRGIGMKTAANLARVKGGQLTEVGDSVSSRRIPGCRW